MGDNLTRIKLCNMYIKIKKTEVIDTSDLKNIFIGVEGKPSCKIINALIG